MASTSAAEFDSFVSARSATLYRTAVLLCGGDTAAAADAVQETMLDIWRRWPRVQAMERADGYAHKVLVTHVLRGRRRTMRLVVTEEVPDTSAVDLANGTIDRHDLWTVVRQLPPKQRAVVVLRFYEDMTEAQVAHLLDISVGTVKSHTSRALEAMRQHLPANYTSGGAHA